MRRYQRLTIEEREEISRQLAMGHRLRAIARTLNRSASTLSREIKRCRGQDIYRAIPAERRAQRNAHRPRKRRKLENHQRLRETVIDFLNRQWSPEQIANTLKIMYPADKTMQVSHETIYAYLYVKPRTNLRIQLAKSLRQQHKRRRKNGQDRRKYSPIQNYLGIDQRPLEANSRVVPGHWEGDLLMGSRGLSALGILVERVTKKLLLAKLSGQDSTTVRKAFALRFSRLPKNVKRSLTYDQGKEMAEHRLFTKQTKIQVYFAEPHSPWQRATCENINGLLRQYFPKGTNFHKISYQQVNRVENLLNERPRKSLNWLSPDQVFAQTVALEL